jgi:uncharacterized protein involved in exopolysaccharide biosynthesis
MRLLETDLEDVRKISVAPEVRQLDVVQLVMGLVSQRWLIIGITCVTVVAAVAVGYLRPRTYEASMVLVPVTEDPASGRLNGLASGLSQLGGLASLAGLGGASGTRRAESLAALQSQMLAERFIDENNLLPVLYSKFWDKNARKWTVTSPERRPSLWKGGELFRKKVMSVTDNAKTGVVTMTIEWRDPAMASQWANGIVSLVNSYSRATAIDQAEWNIEYLKEQLGKTNVVELQQSIYSLMEGEVKKEMIARGTKEYALKVIDPAEAPERPSSLAIWVFALMGVFVGLVLSAITLAVVPLVKAVRERASAESLKKVK